MRTRNQTWIVVADNRRGRLLCGRPVPPGRYHIDEVDSLENQWEEHQRGRPSPRAGKNGNSYASQGHENEERLLRFARDVATWLRRKTGQLNIDQVDLFAPPQFLGALRRSYPRELDGRITEHEGNLEYMQPAELVHHPTISKLLASLRHGASDLTA